MLLIASFPPLSLSLSRSLNLSPSPPFSSPHCASAFTLRLTSSPHSVHRPLSPDMYPLDLTCTLKRELGQSLLTLYRITTARPAAPSPLSSAPYLPLAAAHPPAPTHRVAAQAIVAALLALATLCSASIRLVSINPSVQRSVLRCAWHGAAAGQPPHRLPLNLGATFDEPLRPEALPTDCAQFTPALGRSPLPAECRLCGLA